MKYVDARITFQSILAHYIVKSHEYCIEHGCKYNISSADYVIGELLAYCQYWGAAEDHWDDSQISEALHNGLYIAFSVDTLLNELEPEITTGSLKFGNTNLAHTTWYKLTERGLDEYIPTASVQ